MSLPNVFIEGGLVADPELRFSDGGKAWASMRIVAKDRKRGPSGEWEDGDPTFIDVVCFGKQAENLTESASKGDTIMVYGRMKERTWQTEAGEKRSAMQIAADSIGLSLVFHPARIQKAERSQAQTGTGDPWGAQEPPF